MSCSLPTYQVSIAKSEVGFNKKVARALGTASASCTPKSPAYLAKNRYELLKPCPSTGRVRGSHASAPITQP